MILVEDLVWSRFKVPMKQARAESIQIEAAAGHGANRFDQVLRGMVLEQMARGPGLSRGVVSAILRLVATHGSSTFLGSAPRRLVAALAMLGAVWGGLGIHLGPHSHFGSAPSATEAVAACAHHLRTAHLEPQRTVHLRACPACLFSHSNLGLVRPPSPARSAAAPEVLSLALVLSVSLLAPDAPSSRGPPALSV